MKQGQPVKLYKFCGLAKKQPYKLLGEFTYQSRTRDFIILKSTNGYKESVSIIDLRLRRYRIMLDGREYKLPPIEDTMELERQHKDAELYEYRQNVGAASYQSMFHNNQLRKAKRCGS